ncbi:hypothetical protein JCM3765_007006 [Sporobolomyces pararoseus]
MLSRTPPKLKLDFEPSSTDKPLALPGLISSLRPIKRISTQLNDELNLIHRFSYKNKNQHKSSVWWKRVIHVDRTLHRTLEEVESLLSQFGWRKDSDEVPNVEREQLVRGLLQLPRSLLLVEKSVQVLLNCVSILEQLIETKAFLAFILVVVSLIARLHSLSLVLHDELTKLSSVLLLLVETNELSRSVDPLIGKLPKQLQKYLTSTLTPRSLESTPSTSLSTPAPLLQTIESSTSKGDDLGDVIVRKPKRAEETKEEPGRAGETTEKLKKKKRTIPPVRVESMEEEPTLAVNRDEVAALPPPKKKKKMVRTEESAEGGKGSLFPFSPESETVKNPVGLSRNKERNGDIKVKKKKKLMPEGAAEDQQQKVLKEKKKKKARKSIDEIDAIFG